MIYQLKVRRAEKWSGVTGYNLTSKGFQPSISRSTKRLNLGILSSTEEPSDKGKKDGFTTKGEELRWKFEKALGLKKGDMSDIVHRNGKLVSDFWKDYSLEVKPEGLELDTSNPSDELAVILLKASRLITTKGKRSAHAKFELYSEEEQAQSSNNRREEMMKAFVYLDNMSTQDKLDYVISKGYKADNTKPEIIGDMVGRDVQNNPEEFNLWIKSGIYKKTVELYKWVQAGVIRKAMNKFIYGELTLGISEGQTLDFIANVRNQEIVVGIMQEYDYQMKLQSNVTLETEAVEEESKVDEPKVEIKKADNTKPENFAITEETANDETGKVIEAEKVKEDVPIV